MVADAELRPILDQLRQALPPAHAAMEEVRRRLEICWPRKPSLNALDAEAHDLCKAAMQLVVAGGRSTWGASPMLITAGKDTLSAFGVQSSDPFDVASWEWNPQSVDSEAPSHLAMSAATLLHEALSNAEECNREIGRLLDDIGRLAPAESWLPEWSVDHATAYIAGVRWRSSRPPQPPHEYTIRDWRPDLQRLFLAFAQLIQTRGVLKTWGDTIHAYLELDGLEYWTMGARVPETTVINRASTRAPNAAQPLPPALDAKRLRAVEYSLAYRRNTASAGGDTGILGERLRTLISPGSGVSV
jgi:hypothetical protein